MLISSVLLTLIGLNLFQAPNICICFTHYQYSVVRPPAARYFAVILCFQLALFRHTYLTPMVIQHLQDF